MMNYASIFLAFAIFMPVLGMEDTNVQADKKEISPKRIHFAQPESSSPKKEVRKEPMPSVRIQKPSASITGSDTLPMDIPKVNKKTSFTGADGMMAAMIAAEPGVVVSAGSPRGERFPVRVRRDSITHSDILEQEQRVQPSEVPCDASATIFKMDNIQLPQDILEVKEALTKNNDDELNQNLAQARLIQEAKDIVMRGDVNVEEFSRLVRAIIDEKEKALLLRAAILVSGENPLLVAGIIGLICTLKNEQAKSLLWEFVKKNKGNKI